MKNKTLVIVISIILWTILFSGCNEKEINNNITPSEEDRFIGTWKSERGALTITFFSDDDCSFFGLSGYWEIKDEKLVITTYEVEQNIIYDYSFSNDDKTLTLTEGKKGGVSVFTKQ